MFSETRFYLNNGFYAFNLLIFFSRNFILKSKENKNTRTILKPNNNNQILVWVDQILWWARVKFLPRWPTLVSCGRRQCRQYLCGVIWRLIRRGSVTRTQEEGHWGETGFDDNNKIDELPESHIIGLEGFQRQDEMNYILQSLMSKRHLTADWNTNGVTVLQALL